MKVFITGATGFIGSHLVQRLAVEKEVTEIRCLVRRTSRTEALAINKVHFYYGDVTQEEAVRAGLEGCDILLHLASLYSMWLPDPHDFDRVNVEGTRVVMETALDAGVGRVVNVSTVAVYGRPQETPFTEDCAPGPVLFSEYGRTKAAADRLAWGLAQERDLPLVSIYPGIVLGGGDHKASGQYIQDFIFRRIPSTIFHHSVETYVHVNDVVEAIWQAARRPNALGQKYLIGKEWLDGNQYADLIQSISGVRRPLFRLPDPIVMAAAYLLTGLSRLTHRPPWWGLSVDAGHTLQAGFQFDGSKAERELGIRYTPIFHALTDAVDSYRQERRQASTAESSLSES